MKSPLQKSQRDITGIPVNITGEEMANLSYFLGVMRLVFYELEKVVSCKLFWAYLILFHAQRVSPYETNELFKK